MKPLVDKLSGLLAKLDHKPIVANCCIWDHALGGPRDVFEGGPVSEQPDDYEPDPANKVVLGKVLSQLKKAAWIDQDFDLQPAYLAMLPNDCLYFDSELQLDTDGWPDGEGKGDKYWKPETSLKYADKSSVDANHVPYFVLPLPKSWANGRGINLGDYAAVIYKGKVSYAVFGDEGPPNKIGEGSIQLLRALGEERLKHDGFVINTGAGPGIVTIVFPGSGHLADQKDSTTLLSAIQSEGRRLFLKITK